MRTKYPIYLLAFLFVIVSCNNDDDDEDDGDPVNTLYKQEMRDFVQNISQYAKIKRTGFFVIPQNGQELVTTNGDDQGAPDMNYLNAIDGVGREDLFYGFDYDNEPTPPAEIAYMTKFLDICKQHSVHVLVTDYCSDHFKMNDSYAKNQARSYISFAAPDRELNRIPGYPAVPFNENADIINNLNDAKNFLYLLNPENFASKQHFINDLSQTNYDIIIMDLFFVNQLAFTAQEIDSLKIKRNGSKRLVIAYMSIGEAEDYRYYWNNDWYTNPPEWLAGENPDWPGNYVVKYWMPGWQQIIFGNPDAYLDKILDSGFDGVYLDIIDAFEYFEGYE